MQQLAFGQGCRREGRAGGKWWREGRGDVEAGRGGGLARGRERTARGAGGNAIIHGTTAQVHPGPRAHLRIYQIRETRSSSLTLAAPAPLPSDLVLSVIPQGDLHSLSTY